MESTPSVPEPAREERPPETEAGCAPRTCAWARNRFIALAVLLIAFTFVLYAESLSNTALFHHVSSTVRDSAPDNPILRSRALFWKIWGQPFLLTTEGQYRPLGYAVFALFHRAMPDGAELPWHVILVALHALAVVFVFLALKPLLGDWPAASLAAVYAALPVFAPIVNDVNMIYLGVGLVLGALALAAFVAYARTRSAAFLVISLLAFGAATFTFREALVLPALMAAALLLDDRAPRAGAVTMALMALGVLAAAAFGLPEWAVLLWPYAAVAAIAGARADLGRIGRLVATLAPFGALAGVYLATAATMKLAPIQMFGREQVAFVTDPAWVQWFFLTHVPLFAVGVGAGVLALVSILAGGRMTALVTAAAIVCLCFVTAGLNRSYATDVSYWRMLDAAAPGHPCLQYNLGVALADAKEWEEARDVFLGVRYGTADADRAVVREWWPIERDEVRAGIGSLLYSNATYKLGTVYHGLGNDKVAGYFAFPKDLQWGSRVQSKRLVEIGDFCFATGYISWAENHYASALIIDPYDARLYVALGKCMMYKNFFRAAADHFEHALTIEPDNQAALYCLAFVDRAIGDDEGYADASKRWHEATGQGGRSISSRSWTRTATTATGCGCGLQAIPWSF